MVDEMKVSGKSFAASAPATATAFKDHKNSIKSKDIRRSIPHFPSFRTSLRANCGWNLFCQKINRRVKLSPAQLSNCVSERILKPAGPLSRMLFGIGEAFSRRTAPFSNENFRP